LRFSVNVALFAGLLLALLSSLFVISHVYSTVEVYLSPSDNIFASATHQLGFKFNVTAWVKNVTDLSAYQVRLYYDPTIINATAAWLPTWDPQWAFYGKTSMRLTPVFKTNYAQVGDVIYGDAPFAGTGQLAVLEFQIVKSPSKMGDPACTLGIDNPDTYLIDSSGMNEIPALKTNGSYIYLWSPPPRPHLAINPTFIKQSDLMSSFDVEVNIMALDSGWGLTNATMSVTFNSSVIDILGGTTNVTIPANWNGPNEVNIIHSGIETVNITARNATVAAGNVLVATIRFTVMSHGLTDIVFSSARLNDHIMEIPTDPPMNGSVNTQQLILDVAVNDVKSSKSIIGKGLVVEINVTVENKGHIPATFNVTVYGNASILEITELTLSNGSTTILNFSWNTTAFAKGNYMLSAQAWPVQDDINATNNLYADNWIMVAMIGDVAGGTGTFPNTTPDGKVDVKDLAVIAKCYGANYPDPKYYTNYDLNSDRKIDIKDLALAAKNYGKIDP
jgi:hypothetical protein